MNSRRDSLTLRKSAYFDSERPAAQTVAFVDSMGSQRSMFAHSFEFVAKPSETQQLQTALPSSMTRILKDVTGFAGCLVLVASLEARLVTVVTLWKGPDSHKRCAENIRWIQTILAPYMDHRLRLQTYLASVPPILEDRPATSVAGGCFINEPVCAQEEEVCLA